MMNRDHVGVALLVMAPCVRIVHLTGPVFAALADGDLEAANRSSPVPLPPYFAGPAWAGIWRMRRDQVALDPQSAAWVTGVIWDEARALAVGRGTPVQPSRRCWNGLHGSRTCWW